jgi:hypothetical protein
LLPSYCSPLEPIEALLGMHGHLRLPHEIAREGVAYAYDSRILTHSGGTRSR